MDVTQTWVIITTNTDRDIERSGSSIAVRERTRTHTLPPWRLRPHCLSLTLLKLRTASLIMVWSATTTAGVQAFGRSSQPFPMFSNKKKKKPSAICSDKTSPHLHLHISTLRRLFLKTNFQPPPPCVCLCVTHGNFPNNVTSPSWSRLKVDVYCCNLL